MIGAVIRQTEDNLALVECFASGACAITAPCRLRKALGEALAAFLSVLDGYTLADLLGDGVELEIAGLLGLSVTIEKRTDVGDTTDRRDTTSKLPRGLN